MAASERNRMDPEAYHPVSASHGPLRSLPAKIQRLLSEPEHDLHEGGKEQALLLNLKNRLQQLIDGYLMEPSEVEYPTLTAKCWVEEVREMSYDIDDFLDELVQVKAAQKKLRGRIARFRQGRSRSRWFAGEVSRFLAHVEEVIQRHDRYKLNNLDKRSTAGGSVERPLPPLAAVLGCLDDSKLGKLLVEWLTTDEEGEGRLQVASIVGFPGVGKTTLATEVYRRHGRRFDCRAFVRSSRKPNVKKLLTNILLQVRPCQPPDASELCDLASTIRAHLQSKRYFIVIDDLWASSTWDFIHQAFPHDNSLSRILTTTEVEVVAHRCCGHNSKHIFKMEPLSKETTNKLFFSRFVGGQSEFPGPCIADTPKNLSIKEKISSEIVNIFGDFPLAIIAIASLLARQSNMNQWNYIWSSLVSNLKTNRPIEGIEQVLSLCYTCLPDHLKTCMLYFSLYQENDIIFKDELVERWIAEGFISVKEGKVMKEVACAYFDELVNSGMIQPVHINHNDEVLSCTVHYMIFQLIQDKSIEDNFVTTIHHSEINIGLSDKIHRLSLHFGDAEDVKVPVKRIMQVRSLAFYGPFRCKPSLAELRFLRVIVLRLRGDLDNMKFEFVTVSTLRYLEIACNVRLKLQIQQKDLQYLETLNIDSRVIEVPQDIVHLSRLLHLRLPGDTNLPNGFGCMSSLQTLGCFDLSSNSADNVQSLGKLTNLRNLRLTCSNMLSEKIEENLGFMATVLSNLSNLKSLDLLIPAAGSSNASIISCDGLSSVTSPPVHVEKLELSPRNFIFSRLPRWIGDLGKLSSLKIAVRELSQGDIDILKKLNALAALSLHVRTIPAERIVFDEGFPALKHFKFVCSALFIVFKKGALPNVRTLKLGFNCNTIKQYSPADASFQNLTGLAVVAAKIGCESESVSGRQTVEFVLNDAFRNCARRLVICLQWVDWIFYGDREVTNSQAPADVVKKNSTENKDRRDDNRITLPPESLKGTQKPVADDNRARCVFNTLADDNSARCVFNTMADSSAGCVFNTVADSSAGLNTVGNKPATVMENAMISVSTGAMSSLLKKLETLTSEPYVEVTGMAEQWLILKDELQAMNGLLKQLSNTAEQNMVKCRNKMRELTYEIEDSIDDILFSNINKELGSVSSQDRIMPHDFMDQIQKIIAEVEEAQVQSMENKTEMRTFERSSMSREQLLARLRDERNGLVGMDGPREWIVEQLLCSTQKCLEGVCILGVAGIGKTTLATQVYNDIKWQFDNYVFISASKKVDSSDEDRMAWLCTSILSQLKKNGNIQDTNNDMPIKGVLRCLQGKRFLVVIDDVWSADTLTNIKLALPGSNTGSRIIVTTRSSDVAESCGKHLSTSTYQMDRLKFEQSLSLFRSVIFGSGRSCPLVTRKGHEEIVQACDGVPLAVRVVAGVLSSKPTEMEQWTTFRALRKQEGLDQYDVEWLREILVIGYSDLGNDLKTCLLYLSAFPENRVFRKDRLIRRWAAEGFLRESGDETLWETGECYFLELIARKLIEPVYDEEDVLPIGCKISGSVYDFIASLSSEENLVASDATDVTFSILHGVSVRRLSVDLSSDAQEKPVVLYQGEESSKLRTLTVVGDFHFGWMMPDLSTFKHVRVLDLEDCKGLETENLRRIGRLSLLRYLGIGGTNVTTLPQEIMALEHLTTLDIRRTRVRNLPACRGAKLVSLLADGFNVRGGMEGMQTLEEISKVLLGGDGSLPSELVGLVNKLRRLRMLGVRFGRLYNNNQDRKGVKDFLEEVGKSNLQSLLLDNCLHWLLDVLLESWAYIMPPQLGKLELRVPSCLEQVPEKIASLVALTHLHIKVSEAEADGVRALGSLPSLELLKLESNSSSSIITVSREDGFRRLKVFWYECGGGMGLQFETGAMPQLRRLRLDLSVRETMSRFGSFAFGIQRLSSLSHVCATTDCEGVSDTPEVEAAERKIRDQASQNPNRPVLELRRRRHGHLVPPRGQLFYSSGAAAVPAEGSVITIHSIEEWTKQIDEANRSEPKKLVVVDFTASWCGPSLQIAPVVADLSVKFPDVVFLKVDVDDLKDIAAGFSVEGMPTFVFMKDGEVKDRLEGAHVEELLNKFRQQMAPGRP